MDRIETDTRKWIEKIVIGLGLCPFAAKVYFDKRIRFTTQSVMDADALFGSFKKEIQHIIDGDCDTSIIMLSDGPEQFQDYLDLLDVFTEMIKNKSLNEEVQLAKFHPKFQFENTHKSDIENYTNRSPYPLIHILKVQDVADAIASHPDIKSVPVNNIKTLKELGLAGLLKLQK